MMTEKIRIKTAKLEMIAALNQSKTAQAIVQSLPVKSRASRWGDEIYFSIPVDMPEEADARQDMEIGELGYWPEGTAFCIFFGPTPVSSTDQPRAYSNVNPIGKIEGEATQFRTVNNGDPIEIELA
jgi:hypothetical protein